MKKILSKQSFLFIIIVALAFVLRVYLLGVVPPGLTNDEADIGYDAYSLLLTARDQWGEFLPLTSFKGFGDYRLPLYTYFVVPMIAVFDLSAFAVRLPSAIFGTISTVLVFFVARKLTEKSEVSSNVISFAAMSFMAISPWAVGLSRIGIESNVAITFLLSAVMVFLYARKHIMLYFLSSVFFVLTFYTYTSYTLFTPLTILVLGVFFRKDILKQKKIICLSLLLCILLVLPLFLTRSTAGTRASQIGVLRNQNSVGILANLNDRRGSCSEKFPDIVCKISENKVFVFGGTILTNYLNHFSLNFLYLNGTNTQYSILPPRGLFYLLEMVFLGAGIVYIVRRNYKPGLFMVALLLLSPIPDALTGDGHYSRASNMMPFMFILEGIGIAFLWELLSRPGGRQALALKGLLFTIIFIPFFIFSISYLTYFPKYYSSYSQYGYQSWTNEINNQKESFDRIYLSRYGNDTKQYIYYLFFSKYDPIKYQSKKDVVLSDDNGWVSVDRIENLWFTQRIPTEEELTKLNNRKILLVSHPTEFPKLSNFNNTTQVLDRNNNGIFVFMEASLLLEYYKKSGIENVEKR